MVLAHVRPFTWAASSEKKYEVAIGPAGSMAIVRVSAGADQMCMHVSTSCQTNSGYQPQRNLYADSMLTLVYVHEQQRAPKG